MKNFPKLVISIAFIISIAVSFFAGSHLKAQAQIEGRMQRCHTLLTFAIDKAENEDLSNQDLMEALISNVYAAYQFCDDPHLAAQLHNLWNTLIFEDSYPAGEADALAAQLRIILETMQAPN